MNMRSLRFFQLKPIKLISKPVFGSPHQYNPAKRAENIKEMERKIAEIDMKDAIDVPMDLAKLV